jgi:cold shock CspA family protein
MNGRVSFESTKGFVFIEADESHQSVYCHIAQVNGGRCLHLNDFVSFDLAPSSVRPNAVMAVNVKYLGHILAHQTGDNGGVL